MALAHSSSSGLPDFEFSLEKIDRFSLCGQLESQQINCLRMSEGLDGTKHFFRHVIPYSHKSERPLLLLEHTQLSATQQLFILQEESPQGPRRYRLLLDILENSAMLRVYQGRKPVRVNQARWTFELRSKAGGFAPLLRYNYAALVPGRAGLNWVEKQARAAHLRRQVRNWVAQHNFYAQVSIQGPRAFPDGLGGILLKAPAYLVARLHRDLSNEIDLIRPIAHTPYASCEDWLL